eukprot:scaffold41481_cov64-Phaeocystis_antarctica.AAC.4
MKVLLTKVKTVGSKKAQDGGRGTGTAGARRWSHARAPGYDRGVHMSRASAGIMAGRELAGRLGSLLMN